MRKRLRETRDEMTIRDTLRVLRGNVETLFWMLRNTNTSAASGTTITEPFTVDTVETLPPIPTEGYQMVFWTSVGAGTGDDQLWEAHAGQLRWYPCQKPTTLSGGVL